MRIGNRALRWVAVLLVSVGLGCGSTFAQRHKVEPGDTVASLSRHYGIDEAELRRFNRLTAKDQVRPGDVIFVPGARRAVSRDESDHVPPPKPPGVIAAVPTAPSRPPPTVKPDASPALRGSWSWPVRGEVMRGFGTGPTGDNPGLDIAAEPGAGVVAAGAGTVTYAGEPAPAYGTIVILAHPGEMFTVYSKLSSATVGKGDTVAGGQVIGRVARASAGPSHLHFEVRREQQAVDPLLFLPAR